MWIYRMRILLVGCFLVFLIGGCKTHFSGSPDVPDGPHGCLKVCKSWGMRLAGMVQMGEYSNGCICEVPIESRQAGLSVGAVGPSVVGVVLQQRKEREDASGPSIWDRNPPPR